MNRVFRDKPGGLVVDYLGLADQLQKAMANYTHNRIAFEGALGATLERYRIEMDEAAAGRVARQSALPERLPGKENGGRP